MHIPRMICEQCQHEVTIVENSKTVEILDIEGEPYYKISADRWECRCGGNTYLFPASEPIRMVHEEDYHQIPCNIQSRLRH